MVNLSTCSRNEERLLTSVLEMQKNKKYILSGFVFFSIFMIIYFLLDYLNGGYYEMRNNYGLFLVVVNIILNVIMAFTSSIMMNFSSAYLSLSGKEGKGTFFGNIAVFFGMLTYGCTSCVISFFAAVGITFSVAVLPLAGLPYKLISLVILLLGFLWLIYEIKKGKCKIKTVNES